MQQTILSIAGKPGLYRLVSRGANQNFIVESLDETHRRSVAFANDRVTSLSDIAMYTDEEDVPLMDVMESVKTVMKGKATAFNPKKATGDELRKVFAQVLPNYDRERVHTSDMQKLFLWYNILVEAGITDFKEQDEAKGEEQAPEEEKQAPQEQEQAPKEEKKAVKKAKKSAKKEVKD